MRGKMGTFSGSQKGFSLIELIIVIITVGIIAAATAPIFMSGFDAFFWMRDATDTQAQGELAIDRVAREIRAIDPSVDFDSTALPTASQIKFKFPKYDGTSTTEWVTYALQGTNLMRNTDLLASNVTSLVFSYTKQDGTTLTPPLTLPQANSIWLVQITLQVSGSQSSSSLRTTVFLRRGPIIR
jgi:prepilin-type N-terminal cleavage/methylation domain-containing protein